MQDAEKKAAKSYRKVNLTQKDIAYFNARVPDRPEVGCHEWKGNRFTGGYGRMPAGGQKTVKAHRVAMLIAYGEIPDRACVLHHCDNPCCVRVDHLFFGSVQDNNADRKQKGQYAIGEDAPDCKLDAKAVLEIRQRCASGELQKTLAEEFGVSKQCVYAVVSRTTWKHLP